MSFMSFTRAIYNRKSGQWLGVLLANHIRASFSEQTWQYYSASQPDGFKQRFISNSQLAKTIQKCWNIEAVSIAK